jgi:DNA polymerase-3 subunit delta'
MQSILVVCHDKDKRRDYVRSLCEENNIERIDIDWHSFDKTIGIGDIRSIQKKIILKPIKSKTKAVIIDSRNGFTIEAQNAILKILEEPPSNTAICITSLNKNLMLPTILSRCKIIELKDRGSNLSEEISQYLDILKSLPQKLVGEKLKLAQDITKDKGDASLWLEKTILAAREILIKHIKNENDPLFESYYLNILKSFQKAYAIIKTTNANPRLVLENLLLGL